MSFEFFEPLMKSLFFVLVPLWCGYMLGKDAGVKQGAGKMIDQLCDMGYLKYTKKGTEVEIHKLDS